MGKWKITYEGIPAKEDLKVIGKLVKDGYTEGGWSEGELSSKDFEVKDG